MLGAIYLFGGSRPHVVDRLRPCDDVNVAIVDRALLLLLLMLLLPLVTASSAGCIFVLQVHYIPQYRMYCRRNVSAYVVAVCVKARL